MGVHRIKRRAIFLDRDGVLNRAILRDGLPHPPASLSEVEILPGVHAACDLLRKAGFLLVMVTNQPDVARGKQSREVVEAINQMLSRRLNLDDLRTCYHDDPDSCNCRKPQPGLLLEAAQEFEIDLFRSFMIGDRWKDVEAGRRAGCKTIFVDCGYNEQRPPHSDHLSASLGDAAIWILGLEKPRVGDNVYENA